MTPPKKVMTFKKERTSERGSVHRNKSRGSAYESDGTCFAQDETIMDDTIYNDSNRAFLQAFLARTTMTFEESRPILAAIFSVLEDKEILPEDVDQADLNNYITTANTAIGPFDLEIRTALHQTTRTMIYSLVNTTSDPLTQLATTYSADEIAYLKRVLDGMFETNNSKRSEVMAITSFQALGLAKGDGRRETQNGNSQAARQDLTMMQAEKTLKSLVDEGWFEKSAKNFYSLSPRALMELKSWLVDTYNEDGDDGDEEDQRQRIKTCQACREIITVGQRCPQWQCPCRLHDICTPAFFRAQQSTRCPLCKTEWTGKNYVGERVLTMNAKHQQAGPRGGGSARRNTEQTNDDPTNGAAEDEGEGSNAENE